MCVEVAECVHCVYLCAEVDIPGEIRGENFHPPGISFLSPGFANHSILQPGGRADLAEGKRGGTFTF